MTCAWLGGAANDIPYVAFQSFDLVGATWTALAGPSGAARIPQRGWSGTGTYNGFLYIFGGVHGELLPLKLP